MIEAISLWLQNIILLVLIATVLDMLLPNSSIQRYVKFVMGLLILLSIISPMLGWVQKDFSAEKMALRILNYGSSDPEKEWESLKKYSEKLAQENNKEASNFVKTQMESLIIAKVEDQYGINVHSVHVNFDEELKKEQSYPVISSVQLILDKDIQTKRQQVQGSKSQIEPVKQVTINVSGESPPGSPDVPSSPELTASERKLLSDIVTDIAQTWGIDRSRVIAEVKGKQEEG